MRRTFAFAVVVAVSVLSASAVGAKETWLKCISTETSHDTTSQGVTTIERTAYYIFDDSDNSLSWYDYEDKTRSEYKDVTVLSDKISVLLVRTMSESSNATITVKTDIDRRTLAIATISHGKIVSDDGRGTAYTDSAATGRCTTIAPMHIATPQF
jgi:hypothetical protein